MPTEREITESQYLKRCAPAAAVVNAIREQAAQAGLSCCEMETAYHYRHWEDGVVDDPYEGPVGMSRGFFLRARGFHAWCGLQASELPPRADGARRDAIVIRFYEDTRHFRHLHLLPETIPTNERRYNVIFDSKAQAVLEARGFSRAARHRCWNKTFDLDEGHDPAAVTARVAADLAAVAALPCSNILT